MKRRDFLRLLGLAPALPSPAPIERPLTPRAPAQNLAPLLSMEDMVPRHLSIHARRGASA